MLFAIVAMVLLESLWVLPAVDGHGYMLDPPSRASRWRENSSEKYKYYNDNELFCGGRGIQWGKHGGKCGVCGDEYGIRNPKFTYPGKFARNPPLVRTYTEGQLIEVKVKLTTNHKGYFTFKLASLTSQPIRQDQLDQMILKLPNGQPKYNLPDTRSRVFSLYLQLPRGFTCQHCVMQWWYTTANNWSNNRPESFVNCADVTILPHGGGPRPSKPSTRPTRPTRPSKRPTRPTRPTKKPTRPRPTRPSPGGGACKSRGPSKSSSMDKWCRQNCARGYCPSSMCEC